MGTYKLVILYFALIDQLYETMFNKVPTTANDAEWPTSLADWIRHNDDNLLKSSAKILSIFQDDLYPATSVEEIIDVCGLMGEIPSPASFLLEILSSVPSKYISYQIDLSMAKLLIVVVLTLAILAFE